MDIDEPFSSSSSEEDLFFDTREDLSVSSDSCPGSPTNHASDENFTPLFQVWTNDSESIQQRRGKLLQLMGLDPNPINPINPINEPESKPESTLEPPKDITPIHESPNLDLDLEKPFSDEDSISSGSLSNKSSLSRWSSDKRSTTSAMSEDSTVSEAAFEWTLIKDMDSGTVYSLDEITREGNLSNLQEFGSSNLVQNLMKKDVNSSRNNIVIKEKMGWLRKLGIKTNAGENHGTKTGRTTKGVNNNFERVKMKNHKKNSREFSEVHTCQDFKAHNSAILAMKFSLDNTYLATGGENGILRVWSVADRERSKELDTDSSSVYFEMSENYEIAPMNLEKKDSKHKWHSGNLTCVVVPKKVFWIREEPVQDFKGHLGDILDLSWSQSKYLISASVDKTVRLWQIGCETCLKTFSHPNFVTCVQFNPSNEDYFVSGSLDGIIRIWQISLGHVVNWTESNKEIITSVCYQPDGKKVVVGTITGQCRFYDVSDNQLDLKYEVSFQGKKKSHHKRITGFEFCPRDSSRLLIASADSQIRVLEGSEVITTYKGSKSHANHVSASFATKGDHVISCTDDSIYLLNWTSPVTCSSSYERFASHDTSLAIPFNGPKLADLSKYFSLREDMHGLKGTATWPEEKLTPGTSLSKSQYKILKSACQNGTDMWGQVVVTAGLDGRIRSYQNFGLPVQT